MRTRGLRRTEELQHTDIGAGSAVDDEVVDDLEALDRTRREAHDLLVLLRAAALALLLVGVPASLEGLPAALFEVAHHDLARLALLDRLAATLARTAQLVGRHRAVHGARETHAQVDADAGLDRAVHDRLVVRKVKVGEEAEGAEGKGQHGRHDALEEPGGEEHGAVAPELCAVILVDLNVAREIGIERPGSR